jgi:hypothetical protein
MPVSSMSTEMAMRSWSFLQFSPPLKSSMSCSARGSLRMDHLAELASELRVHLVEQLRQQTGVVDVAGEDDGLAWQLAIGIADAVVHQVAQDDAVGVLVEDCVVNGGGFKLKLVGVDALVFKLGNLLIAQVRGLDAIAQELGGVGHDLEGNQVAIGNGLLQRVVGRWQLVVATKELAGTAADHLHRGGRQAHLQGIEVLEDVAIQVVDGAVRFVGHDEVKEPHVEAASR